MSYRWPSRLKIVILTAGSSVIFSFWVSVCAAAPEYIWQGLVIAFSHPSLDDMLSALLLGSILAFFIEPLTDRARRFLQRLRGPEAAETGHTSVFFTVGLSLAFAIASVCLHDAMSAFVSGRHTGPADTHSAVVTGLSITIGWAIVPFAVAIAWLGAGSRWLAVPSGLVAAASSSIAGWAFAWTMQGTISTAIPCVLILAFGYRAMSADRWSFDPSRLARIVALVAVAWLSFAVAIDAALGTLHAAFRLYDGSASFWTDLRFYIGWCLGLLLAPAPTLHRSAPLPAP